MEKEPTLAALRGLLDHLATGQIASVRREGESFAIDIQTNDEPAT